MNYASDLTAAAEQKGIKCGFLLLTFGENTTSHTLNVFALEDGQTMYVDMTGSTNKSGVDRYFFELNLGEDYEKMGMIYNMYEFW
ncbi:hypothetical protein [Methanimicrococcus blatticola]|uniref:hypothetical protein n=1 Tax=Methanimicrococcus blatticola TaxID=91560 RepID=UPI00105FC57F|nr:hypothetical protein [Methanimicrococcus blatticola]MBZ3935029.1 hypothetical protein [Methanimicrococcus blatticola]MCC2508874.1 hypothetical protein [Methanimicrococcus blatticola]